MHTMTVSMLTAGKESSGTLFLCLYEPDTPRYIFLFKGTKMTDVYASNTKTAINDLASYSSNRKTAINDQASKDAIALEVSAQDLLQWSGGTWLAVDKSGESFKQPLFQGFEKGGSLLYDKSELV